MNSSLEVQLNDHIVSSYVAHEKNMLALPNSSPLEPFARIYIIRLQNRQKTIFHVVQAGNALLDAFNGEVWKLPCFSMAAWQNSQKFQTIRIFQKNFN